MFTDPALTRSLDTLVNQNDTIIRLLSQLVNMQAERTVDDYLSREPRRSMRTSIHNEE